MPILVKHIINMDIFSFAGKGPKYKFAISNLSVPNFDEGSAHLRQGSIISESSSNFFSMPFKKNTISTHQKYVSRFFAL
jgi:hypothetical protein